MSIRIAPLVAKLGSTHSQRTLTVHGPPLTERQELLATDFVHPTGGIVIYLFSIFETPFCFHLLCIRAKCEQSVLNQACFTPLIRIQDASNTLIGNGLVSSIFSGFFTIMASSMQLAIR